MPRSALTGLTDEQITALPGVLIGSAGQRETYGLSYFGLLEPHMPGFAVVIDRLR